MNESLAYKIEKRIYDFLPHEPEKMATVLLVIGMAVYYLWRMFAITPQYDELLTYYNFISRGPIVSATTWPDANNHIGYSVLSSLVNLFGNPFIGLRGVAYVCAVSNLILVNRICKKYYSHGIPFGATLLYSSMQIVNEYSAQGRGYTLATTLFLVSVYIAGYICSVEDTKLRKFVSLSLAFTLGMYVVPDSIYWILPLFLAISVYLLYNAYRSRHLYGNASKNVYLNKFRRFFKFTVLSVILTFVLYSIMWLSIGSQLLISNAQSDYFGISNGTILVRAPVSSLMAGLRYMLEHPYVRSHTPEEFNKMYFGWSFSLYDYMLPGLSVLVMIIVLIALMLAIQECIRHFAYSRTVINLIMIANILIPSLMILISHKLPYLKVFYHGAFVVTLAFATFVEMIVNVFIRIYNKRKQNTAATEGKAVHRENETAIKDDHWYSGIGIYTHVAVILIYFCYRVLNPDFSAQLGERENDLFNTMYIANVQKRHNPAVLDSDQQYLLKFGWDIDCKKTDVVDADCVIIDKDMLEPGRTGDNTWKFYQDYDTIDWDYMSTMHSIYENENFILYVK